MISTNDSSRRVVVTGVGVVSPVGNSKDVFWRALVEGRSGITAMPSSRCRDGQNNCVGMARDFGGRIKDFGPLGAGVKKIIRKALKLMNRETQIAVAATQQAVDECGLGKAGYEPDRVGVCFGAGNVSIRPEDFRAGVQACTNENHEFEFDRWGSTGLEQVDPLWLLRCLPNMPACHLAIINNFRGPNNSITQRGAAVNLSVAEAYNAIVEGAADAMITGATGTTILPCNPLPAGFETDGASAAVEPETVCRPFDRNRTGAVAAEGAAALVLEEYAAARRRGATIYGEVVGAGSSCVVSPSRKAHHKIAAANAMRAALRKANLSPDDVGHVHAHGLSTRRSDIDEAAAIREIFGSRAMKLPVVAVKSNTGNAGAGSGAMELVASLLALKHGTLFPLLNYEDPDPQCPVAPVRSADRAAGESFLNLNLVAQGQASCIAMRVCD